MTNMKHTKRALLLSVLSLILCFSMMLGTTYAWFTDSVTSAGNKIQSGTLKVDLELYDAETGVWNSIKDSQDPIFNYDKWEPGYIDAKLLMIENEGTLALKWKAMFMCKTQLSALADVIDVYVLPSDTVLTMPGRDLAGYTRVGTVAEFVNTIESTTNGVLEKEGDVAYLGIALKMQESAGNEYQNLTIGEFDIQIVATQMAFEEDSFDANYDALAKFPMSGVGSKTVSAGDVMLEFDIRDKDISDHNSQKVGSAKVPAAALKNDAKDVAVSIYQEPSVDANVTVASDKTAVTYAVSVTNLKENNTELVTVSIRVGTGLTGVKVYHTKADGTVEQITNAYYDGEYVNFQSASFSPYTVVFDTVAVETPEDEIDKTVPKAKITLIDPATVDFAWTGWGGYNPAAGAAQKLEAVYLFESPETVAEASESYYKDWYCDYYVKFVPADGSNMSKLPEGSITLGGNYGGYGWVGFDNPEVDVNTFIPLLGSVLGDCDETGNLINTDWTYVDVIGLVDKFWCGVGVANGNADGENDVDLTGGKFVVELRLTNPKDLDETIAVNTVTYTFGGNSNIDGTTVVTTGQGLQDAVNNGDEYISLGKDIDLSQGIVIPGN